MKFALPVDIIHALNLLAAGLDANSAAITAGTTTIINSGGGGGGGPTPPTMFPLLCVTGDIPITLASTAEGLPVYVLSTFP